MEPENMEKLRNSRGISSGRKDAAAGKPGDNEPNNDDALRRMGKNKAQKEAEGDIASDIGRFWDWKLR
ncbi:hypothetical protein PRIPAC_83204 [Pristionchus pacificus]|uniref:Uncharacterized protein n=1 Tax=Pristionchus pacificus TaxID=54126 RepID=A0A2A6BUE5_PRIPA|nr:hypothetical protein PRIPAC_83204 [Pristionchus pacificus]|eukprot:PDM69436.1 hypothetical protein PRIPAC_44532 [Pristionchus pacificus]